MMFCKGHSGDEAVILCPFSDSGASRCHQCGEPMPPQGDDEPRAAIRYCSKACDDAWDAAHPGYWSPIEDTLPGGRYDGIWENSGLRLERPE